MKIAKLLVIIIVLVELVQSLRLSLKKETLTKRKHAKKIKEKDTNNDLYSELLPNEELEQFSKHIDVDHEGLLDLFN